MTTDQERMATLEARQEELQRRVNQLEANQRWGVMAILALVFKALMDFLAIQA